MDDLIASTTAFIVQHGMWTAPIIGLLAFGESLVLIGLFLPATALMIAVGGLIGRGLVDPVPVILCAIVGAVLGDWISFVIGRKIGPSAFRRRPFLAHRHAVARARLFFRRHGLASILLGRFLGPVRATIPLVAGAAGMNQRRFQIANIASAILWVPALFAPGFLAARSLGAVKITEWHVFGLLLLIVLMTLGGGMIAARLLGKGARRRRPATPLSKDPAR